jgi:hypothetical protein
MDQPLKNIFLILLIFTVLGVFTFLLRIERVEMSAESADNMFLINTEGCKIPNLNPYDPLIKACLNNGEELKCAVQEDLVYSVNGTITKVLSATLL